MDTQNQPLEALQDIRRMMERSSRFLSLSGLSGIAAGLCALAGAWFGHREIQQFLNREGVYANNRSTLALEINLIKIAAIVFVVALVLAYLFTYRRAKKNKQPLWDSTSRRLLLNTAIPIAVGGMFIMGMLYNGIGRFVAPASLVFYGLALVNGSKYTIGEIRYLGYCEIILGIINLWLLENSLLFWAIGFGLLHIIYGAVMWWKYDRA
jgi:predicted lysophospholipase L1 biosynthesis ABC-type transport system permease subunit